MIVGLDVSTSIVGICKLTNDGKFVSTDYVDLRKIKDFIEKCEKFHDALFECADLVDKLFIEDKLSGFSGGKTMQQTMMKLAGFNGAVTYIAAQVLKCRPIHIHPSTAKATMKIDGLFIPKGADKKKLTLEFCKKIEGFPYIETKNGNPQAYCYDQADAYLIARAGFLKGL